MRILIVVPDRLVGGGQLVAMRLARELAQRHEVSIIYAFPERAAAEPPAVPPGVRVLDSAPGHFSYYLPAPVWFLLTALDFLLPPWRWGRETGFLIRWLNRRYQQTRRRHFLGLVCEGDFDMVNSHTWPADAFVSECLPERWRVPWVVTMHGCYEILLADLKRHPEYSAQMMKILSRADRVMYISDKNLDVLFSIPSISLKNSPVRVSNGVDIPAADEWTGTFQRDPDIDLRAVIVSRAVPEKGWEEAIQVVLALNREDSLKIQLVLVGAGKYQHQLEKQYPDPRIEFHGHSSNPMRLISACDVGLLPSYFTGESSPLSVIEYLACGKPVIATDVGEIRTMISHEGSTAGILVPLGPDGKADRGLLRQALLDYAGNPDKLRADAGRARQAAEKFDIARVVASYETVFETCLAGRVDGAP